MRVHRGQKSGNEGGNRKRSVQEGKRRRERERERFLSSCTPRLYFRLLTRFPDVSGRSAVSFPGPFISRVIIIRILRCGGCGYLEALVSVVAVAAPETPSIPSTDPKENISFLLRMFPSSDFDLTGLRLQKCIANPID